MFKAAHREAVRPPSALSMGRDTMSSKLITVQGPWMRVALADIAKAENFKVAHSTVTKDTYTLGSKTIITVWTGSVLSEAQMLQGSKVVATVAKGSASKLQQVWLWICPKDSTLSLNTLFTNRGHSPAALKARLAKGEIKAAADAKAEVATKAATKAAPKPKAPKAKAPAAKAPEGPSQEQRQAARDQEHLAEL